MTVPAEPQPILTALTEAAIFLVLTVQDGAEEGVADVLPDMSGIVRSVGFRAPEAALTCVVGLGSELWDRVFDGPKPAGLHPFVELRGARHTAVATPGDLLLHIRGRRMDVCFELAQQLQHRLAASTDVVDEVHGFRYFEQRDLLGFVDGTENPAGPSAVRAVTIGDEDPDFAGASYVVVQKYLHDMASWNAVTVEEQNRVIGRTKLDDIELPDGLKPPNSHVALNTIVDDDGEEQQIVRDNMPFGSIADGESGTYFIGYSRSPDVTEQMLRNMFLGNPPGNHDRILDFSTAVTGGLFFVPSADFLDDPPATRTAAAAPADRLVQPAVPPTRPSPSPDGSLRIGSLKRS